jgi:uncharacterized protein (TIGR01319 family)
MAVEGEKREQNKAELSSPSAKRIIAIDCGSTTSKARLFEKIDDVWRFICSGEAPTTVETPFENVLFGIRNAVKELEDKTSKEFLRNGQIITPLKEKEGVDLFLCTSSAGGGLQMIVTGVTGMITGESARRAALGAGAIVMDVLTYDDGRTPYERIERIRLMRPDIILITGGVDGGAVRQLEEIVYQIESSDPKSRQGVNFKLPVIYAGNKTCREDVHKILGENYIFIPVANIRPWLERENLEPTRDAIRKMFMEHVMAHAPGYDELMKWTSAPIIPTPRGEGIMFQRIANQFRKNVLGVGLGGATTNLYSIYEGRYLATLSANLGMSYSMYNVLREVGEENITRWLPFAIEDEALCDRIHNKSMRPTTLPQTIEDLLIEHAVAREAIRYGLQEHRKLATPLKGAISYKGLLGEGFAAAEIECYIEMKKVDWICGTGGLLSHAPRRSQSALILIDSFQPEGITKLSQDSVFMMPHLGVLSTVHPEAAIEVFERDCLVNIGTCITLTGEIPENEIVASLSFENSVGKESIIDVVGGSIHTIPFKEPKAKLRIKLESGIHLDGLRRNIETVVEGGEVGIIIDARGRPIDFPQDTEERIRKISTWYDSLQTYPETVYEINMKPRKEV